MPEVPIKRWHGFCLIVLFFLSFILNAIITIYSWKIGVFGFLVIAMTALYAHISKQVFKKELETYISTLSHRVNKAGEEAIVKLPIGMLLYNEDQIVQWVNPMMTRIFSRNCIGLEIADLSELLADNIDSEQKDILLPIDQKVYKVIFLRNERLLYFLNVTEEVRLKKLHEKEQTVIAIIYLDNYDEVTQGMEDQVRSKLMNQVTLSINNWSSNYDIYLKRTSSDRFFAVFSQETLYQLEEAKFDILDEVRESTGKERIPITLSIGVGSGQGSLQELGNLAQSSLDLALGRGGDQVAIKQKNGKVRFYGGKSNAVEKRTRVRARVISHAIQDFVHESDQVIIMGHMNPDMDSIGASIGVLKLAEISNQEAYIVVDKDYTSHDVQKLMIEIEKNQALWSKFITPQEALDKISSNTLLVVVDTHKPSLVIEPKLLDQSDRVIVIDHHRRGEEFIDDAVLVYMEPYASSTAELVTELLVYQPNQSKLDMLEATALLAGIIVDTKSFAVRTGSRTFDAASFLRSKGADTTLVQRFLKEDLDQYIKRSKLIETAQVYRDGMAIAKAESTEVYPHVLVAQTADTLLSMSGVQASFVISKRKDDSVSISARSLGDVNVQIIMEMLEGGGHLSNAATQIENVTIEEAEQLLKDKIDEYLEGRREQ